MTGGLAALRKLGVVFFRPEPIRLVLARGLSPAASLSTSAEDQFPANWLVGGCPPSQPDVSYTPLEAKPLLHRLPTSREEALGLIARYARRSATPVSLRQLLEFGRRPTPKKLLLAAQLMHRELAIRLAHRVVELQSLPYGLSEMRSVRRVKELYENSFADIVMYPRPEKAGEEERRFTELLRHIRDRHADVVRQVACGVLELKQSCGMGADDIHISSFLDRFYTSRIGIRVLISQQVSMSLERARQGYVGIIHIRCRPAHVAADAADAARALAYRHYGEEPPEVIILGKTDLEFPYIEGHLYHVLFELLKNSIRATMEHHLGQDVFPPIKVIIADGQEDVTLKIADEGGGIPRSSLPKIWTYMFTTATIPPEALIQEEYHPGGGSEHPRAVGMDPLAGFGYGLPLSRLYARYFGGELSVASMEGFGTDAYVHLAKLGNRLEAVV